MLREADTLHQVEQSFLTLPREPPTLRGICLLSGLAGYVIFPEWLEVIVTVVLGISGVLGLMPDQKQFRWSKR